MEGSNAGVVPKLLKSVNGKSPTSRSKSVMAILDDDVLESRCECVVFFAQRNKQLRACSDAWLHI